MQMFLFQQASKSVPSDDLTAINKKRTAIEKQISTLLKNNGAGNLAGADWKEYGKLKITVNYTPASSNYNSPSELLKTLLTNVPALTNGDFRHPQDKEYIFSFTLPQDMWSKPKGQGQTKKDGFWQ